MQNLLWAAQHAASGESQVGEESAALPTIPEDARESPPQSMASSLGGRANAAAAAAGSEHPLPTTFLTPPTSPQSPDLDNFVGFMEAKLSHVVATTPPTSPDGSDGLGLRQNTGAAGSKSVRQTIRLEGLPPIPTLEQLKAKKRNTKVDSDGSSEKSKGTATPAAAPGLGGDTAGKPPDTDTLRRRPGILSIPALGGGAADVKPSLRTPSPDSPDPEALAAISGVRTGRMRRVTFGGELIQQIPTCLSDGPDLTEPQPEPETAMQESSPALTREQQQQQQPPQQPPQQQPQQQPQPPPQQPQPQQPQQPQQQPKQHEPQQHELPGSGQAVVVELPTLRVKQSTAAASSARYGVIDSGRSIRLSGTRTSASRAMPKTAERDDDSDDDFGGSDVEDPGAAERESLLPVRSRSSAHGRSSGRTDAYFQPNYTYTEGGLAALIAESLLSAARGTVMAVLSDGGSDASKPSVSLPPRSVPRRLRRCAHRTAAETCASVVPFPQAQTFFARVSGASGASGRSGDGSALSLGGAVMCWCVLSIVLSIHYRSQAAADDEEKQYHQWGYIDDTAAPATGDMQPYVAATTAAADGAAAVASGRLSADAAPSSSSTGASFPLLLHYLGLLLVYWLVSAALLIGTVQLSGAALGEAGGYGYRTALHIIGMGSFSSSVCPGVLLYYALRRGATSTATTAQPATAAGVIDLQLQQQQQQQQQLWAWCVGVAGGLGVVSAAVRVHSVVWLEFYGSRRWHQTGSIERDRWRNRTGRGRQQAEAGAKRGAIAGAAVVLSCGVVLVERLIFY